MAYLTTLGPAIALVVALAAIGSALGLGKATQAAVESTARQPEAAGAIRTTLVIGGALIEALTIYGLVIGIMLMGKFPSVSDALLMIRESASK